MRGLGRAFRAEDASVNQCVFADHQEAARTVRDVLYSWAGGKDQNRGPCSVPRAGHQQTERPSVGRHFPTLSTFHTEPTGLSKKEPHLSAIAEVALLAEVSKEP